LRVDATTVQDAPDPAGRVTSNVTVTEVSVTAVVATLLT
jgi:hypothetical protein